MTLAEVQDDLRIHPLQVINLDEVELTNGIANGHMEQDPGSGKTLTTYYSTVKCIHCEIFVFHAHLFLHQTLSFIHRSECEASASDGARHPLPGPQHCVCVFECNPRCAPHRVHIPGDASNQMLLND